MQEKIKKLGKNYIKPVEVETGDLVQIIRKPELRILDKDNPKKQRERYEIEVKGVKTFNLNQKWRTATLNTTSSDELMETLGDNPDDWVNSLVQIEKRLEKVAGEDKEVLYFHPYRNPQGELSKPDPMAKPVVPKTIDLTQLTPTQQVAIAEIMAKKPVSATS
jgi:hypothetical protein